MMACWHYVSSPGAQKELDRTEGRELQEEKDQVRTHTSDEIQLKTCGTGKVPCLSSISSH